MPDTACEKKKSLNPQGRIIFTWDAKIKAEHKQEKE